MTGASKLPKIKKKLKRANYSLKTFKKNKVTPQFIKNTSLRLHLSTKNRVKSSIYGAITTPSSLRLTNLETKFQKLQKIADKNQFGNIGIPEERLLRLTFCDYRGKGKLNKARMAEYLQERKRMLEDLGLQERKLKKLKEEDSIEENGKGSMGISLALDIDRFMDEEKLRLDN